MSSEKPNFLAQPVVKNIFMFRNGDPYYEARRIVINQKRVSNFETLLREVTGGIQAPFGAVRNIYTPRGGHKVDCLESLQSGEQYVAAGRERFKKLDYQQIGSRKKRLMQSLPMQAKPLPQNRITVSARFLKPIKEPCTIFVVANGDVLNPAMRILIHQRMLGQFDRVLEMITEKMGLRVLGGVRSLYTYEGHQVTDGNQLESGQLYVAVGREKFRKLMYSDLLFTKPRGRRRVDGMKAYSLPPIYRFSKQNGNTSPSKSKSKSQCSESGDGDFKASPPGDNGNNKEHLVSIVREISQARLLSLRKRRSGQSVILGNSDNDDLEPKIDDVNTDNQTPCDQPAEEQPAEGGANPTEENSEKVEENEEAAAENTDGVKTTEETSEKVEENEEAAAENTDGVKATEENSEKVEENEEAAAENTDGVKATEENSEKVEENEEAATENTEEEETVPSKDEQENQEANDEKEVGEENGANDEQNNEREEEATVEPEEKEEEVKGEIKEEVTDEAEEEVKSEKQEISNSNSDETQSSEKIEDGSHSSSEGEKDQQETNVEEEKKDTDDGNMENISNDQNNDVDTGEEEKGTENSNDPGEAQADN